MRTSNYSIVFVLDTTTTTTTTMLTSMMTILEVTDTERIIQREHSENTRIVNQINLNFYGSLICWKYTSSVKICVWQLIFIWEQSKATWTTQREEKKTRNNKNVLRLLCFIFWFRFVRFIKIFEYFQFGYYIVSSHSIRFYSEKAIWRFFVLVHSSVYLVWCVFWFSFFFFSAEVNEPNR